MRQPSMSSGCRSGRAARPTTMSRIMASRCSGDAAAAAAICSGVRPRGAAASSAAAALAGRLAGSARSGSRPSSSASAALWRRTSASHGASAGVSRIRLTQASSAACRSPRRPGQTDIEARPGVARIMLERPIEGRPRLRVDDAAARHHHGLAQRRMQRRDILMARDRGAIGCRRPRTARQAQRRGRGARPFPGRRDRAPVAPRAARSWSRPAVASSCWFSLPGELRAIGGALGVRGVGLVRAAEPP